MNNRNILFFILVFTSTIFTFSQTDKTKRISFSLYAGYGARLPMSDSYYNLWNDVAIGDVEYDTSDGWARHISANWGDYDFSFLRTDVDFLLSKNLSIGLFAFPDKHKKLLTDEGETDNWTGDDSNGLEDHWKLRRKLRIATYNFGPDIKLKVPFNNLELSVSYLYGWSYLLRSAFEFSYHNQLTGTGEKGFLGLIYAQDGNLTKLRYNGSNDFHRLEIGITRLLPEKTPTSLTLKAGYQFLNMDNIKYEVLKYGSETIEEASGFFDIGDYREYQVGDNGDIYIDDEKFTLDLSSFYISLSMGWHSRKNKKELSD